MTEEKQEYPWPFEGRIPLYENGVQTGWVGPILDIRPGEINDPDVEVVDVEISEDGTVEIDGEIVQTYADRVDPGQAKALHEWFKRVWEGTDEQIVADGVRRYAGLESKGPFDKFKFTVEDPSADA